MSTLWVYAHESEGSPIAASFDRSLELGVGKASAAATLAREIATRTPAQVIAFGVAGAYPGAGLSVGDICLVGEDKLADDGVLDERGFRDLASMDLGDAGSYVADPELTAELSRLLGVSAIRGATVSTCSATDALATKLEARTGAAVETMEGAAIGLACAAAGVPWAQLRAVSNLTGDRAKADWDLNGALKALHQAIRVILAARGSTPERG